MCFDLDSAPPIPVISGAAVSHDDLVLEAADGNRLAAFAAAPDEPAATGIVILPDVRGLYRFYEELALRFAERGYAAVAFDFYGRTAGVAKRRDDFDYMPHVKQTTPEGVQADVARVCRVSPRPGRAVDLHRRLLLRRQHSWLAAAAGHALAGAVGFYGQPNPEAIERPRDIAAPILALQARRRPAHHRRRQRRLRCRVAEAGVEHDVVDVRRRAAQLLRPQAGGVRRRLGGRVAAHARLRRAARRAGFSRLAPRRPRGRARARPAPAGTRARPPPSRS